MKGVGRKVKVTKVKNRKHAMNSALQVVINGFIKLVNIYSRPVSLFFTFLNKTSFEITSV